jgi:hypothetical protein
VSNFIRIINLILLNGKIHISPTEKGGKLTVRKYKMPKATRNVLALELGYQFFIRLQIP